jgi:hypothetical protein
MRSAALLFIVLIVSARAAAQTPAPSGPSLVFGADWTESVAGAPLVAGGDFIIAYDPARLPACRAYHDGYPGWQITAFVRFWPSGATTSYPLFDHASTPDGPPDYHSWVEQYPVVAIPAATTEVETWFENISGFDEPCTAWDSDYGRNFHFPVVGAGGDGAIAAAPPLRPTAARGCRSVPTDLDSVPAATRADSSDHPCRTTRPRRRSPRRTTAAA